MLGRVPEDVPADALRVLGLVSFALLFEHYDISLLNNAMKYIKEDLGIAETSLSYFQMMIRLGALPAFFVIPWVDRVGRRRLFLLSLVGMSIGTVLTGFAQSADQFVAAQMITRTFVVTASAVAIVIVAEGMPAASRGWAVGMLAAVSAVGHGFGAILFSTVELLPYGWRALYMLGVVPLFLLPMFTRSIPETERFKAHVSAEGSSWFSPIREFLSHHRGRAVAIMLVAGVSSLGHIASLSFTGYFVLEYHGWEPYQLSIMVLTAGVVGVVGNVAAGRLADRFGRRAVGFVFLSVFPLLCWGFFNGPSWLLAPLWAMQVFFFMGANVIIRALGTELFPTSHRGTSTGALTMMETVGAAIGLLILGLLQQAEGDLAQSIPVVSIGAFVSAFVLLTFPETKQQELEVSST